GCVMYTQYLILTWMPSYLVQARHMELVTASLLSSLAFLAAWTCGIAMGKLSDLLLTPERVLLGHRRLWVVACMGLSSVFVLTPAVQSPLAIFLLITLVKAFLSSTIGL